MAVITGAQAESLTRYAVFFEAAEPPRPGTVVFWNPQGGPPPVGEGRADGAEAGSPGAEPATSGAEPGGRGSGARGCGRHRR